MVQRKRQVIVGGKKGRPPMAQKKKQETTAVGQLIRKIGSLGGGALGAYAGMPAAGAAAGNSLGAAISKWLGFGDYAVSTNSIVQKASTGIPMMHKDGQTVTIRHREFIATIQSSTDFVVHRSFRLNPGDHETFPWLSTVANSFQQYKFKGVVFHYIPTSGNAISGTSPSLGSVMMQTSYRANDSAPTSKSELLNEYWSGEAVPSETFAHPIECNPAENPFNVQYVRRGELPANENPLFYDLGVTHLCTQGQLAANNVLGDVWVTYEVELKKPIVASNVTNTTLDYAGFTNSPTLTQPFAQLSRTYGNLGVTNLLDGFTVAPAPMSDYLVFMMLGGTGLGGNFGTATLTNCILVPFNTAARSVVTTSSLSAITTTFGVRPLDPTRPFTIRWLAPSATGTPTNFSLNIVAQ
nr:MAG: putative coat protein [Eriocheir sinensis tombusvirus 2]